MKITKQKVITVSVGMLLGYMLERRLRDLPLIKELPKL